MNRPIVDTAVRLSLFAVTLLAWQASNTEFAAAENTSAKADSSSPSFFTVDEFDVAADPSIQYKATLARAKKENKRVLLLVGGNWCPWCRAVSKYIAQTESVKEVLHEHYLVQKVATTGDETLNHDFLEPFGYIADFPHIFVLDADGKQLHSQYVYKLEKDGGYDDSKFVAFLQEWVPK